MRLLGEILWWSLLAGAVATAISGHPVLVWLAVAILHGYAIALLVTNRTPRTLLVPLRRRWRRRAGGRVPRIVPYPRRRGPGRTLPAEGRDSAVPAARRDRRGEIVPRSGVNVPSPSQGEG